MTLFGGLDLGLRKITNKHFTDIHGLLNPYGYVLNGNALKNGQVTLEKATVGVEFQEEHPVKYIIEIPKGNFICFNTKMLSDNCDITELSRYLKEHDIRVNTVIAEEFKYLSNNPYSVSDCEIQILIE